MLKNFEKKYQFQKVKNKKNGALKNYQETPKMAQKSQTQSKKRQKCQKNAKHVKKN